LYEISETEIRLTAVHHKVVKIGIIGSQWSIFLEYEKNAWQYSVSFLSEVIMAKIMCVFESVGLSIVSWEDLDPDTPEI
jgi:hypothetical protein